MRALQSHARLHEERIALSYLERGERIAEEATYGDLYRSARVIAGGLVAAGFTGRPLLLVLPQGLDFVRCFLACLLAQVIAVPVPFPIERRSAERCAAIARSAGRCVVVSTREAISGGTRLRCLIEAGVAPADMVPVESLQRGVALDNPAEDAPDRIAFLQFTSGSVSRPKGVVITHGNLGANLAMIRTAFAQDASNSAVSWLPLHHDMGLIGCVLQPLFLGARCWLMSPLAFLQRPLRWLRAIEQYGATTAGAPNFAYEMCVRHVSQEDAHRLDLSGWRLAFCGSEPVRHATLQRFVEHFAPSGFRPEALLPCYGQAEATLLVSAARRMDGIRTHAFGHDMSAGPVVSCGAPCEGTRIATVAPDNTEPAPQGEICVSGPQVSPGFWKAETATVRPDENRELLLDGTRYLRTGDVGRIIDGELYITGRLRDMIIVHGSNIHAEDVEATVLAREAGLITAAAAFGTDTGTRERLIVVCETERHTAVADPAMLLRRVSAAIAEAHGVPPAEVVLVSSGGIERTVSGKIQRSATRAKYLAGNLDGQRLRARTRRDSESAGHDLREA